MTTSILSSDQIEHYRTQGFLVLRDVFSSIEMAVLAEEASRLVDRKELLDSNNLRCRWQNHHDTGGCLFDGFDPVGDISPLCDSVARDRRILERVAAIYGDDTYLFKDKLIFKPPGAKGYALHQDYIGWKDFPRTFVTVLLAIDPADAENGATEVFPGNHHAGYLSPEDGMYHELPLTAIDETRGVKLNLAPGDIAIFGCFTPHRSAPNKTNRWRRQLYLSYNAKRDGGERRQTHYRQFHAWLKERYAEYGKTEVYFR